MTAVLLTADGGGCDFLVCGLNKMRGTWITFESSEYMGRRTLSLQLSLEVEHVHSLEDQRRGRSISTRSDTTQQNTAT